MPTSPWKHYSAAKPDTEYLALLTYLPLKRYRTIPRFIRYTSQVQSQLNETRGIVCYSLKAHIFTREFWTLSVWESEDDMHRFASGGSHRNVMLAIKEDMSGFKNTMWLIQGSQLPPLWSHALERHAAA